MTKGEIKNHLEDLKTNEGRIGYLTKVLSYNKLKGEKLLAPKTVQYAREIRDELYKKREPHLDRTLELSSNYSSLSGDEPEGRVVLPEKRDKRNGKDLGDKLTFIFAIVGVVIGIFFLSSNLTGNTIGNLTGNDSNYFGVAILIVGLIGGYFYIKKKS